MSLRYRYPITMLVIAALVIAGLPAAASGTEKASPPAEVIVRFRDGASAQVRAGLSERRLRAGKTMYGGRGVVVRVPAGQSAETVAASLRRMRGVAAAAPNGTIRPLWTPNDTYFGSQWALTAVQAPAAWDIERGSAAVTVAMVDTGVQIDHPDLVANLDLTRDRDFANGDTVAEDQTGHGTHVAGIIAAATGNGRGVAGVAPGVKTVPLKVIGAGGEGTVSDLLDAIYYAADIGADVVNMSVGEPLNLGVAGDAAEAAIMQDAIDYARARDVVLVGATGNDGIANVYYPAACDGVLTVTGTTRAGTVATYSNHGAQVDIAAPGGDFGSPIIAANGILSTYPANAYRYMTGTSMASPHVAGAAALLRSWAPAATATEVADALMLSAKDIGTPGWDEYSGHGLLQVADALGMLDIAAPDVTRLAGSDRYATALATSRATFASGASTVTVLASGADFPDALSASGLAGAYGGALLLTPPGVLPPGALTELRRLGTTRVVIVGGTSAVSSAVGGAIAAAGMSVGRVQGPDRYATAAAVAEEIRRARGAPTLGAAFLVRGDGYADALAVAPVAYASARPVLLTASTTLAPAARTALESLGTTQVVVAGGESAVSSGVLTQVDALAGMTAPVRWAGADRYDTAAVVAERALDAGLASPDCFGVATGAGFPDALAGGAACGARGGVLLLTAPAALSARPASVVSTRGHDGCDVLVFGGTSAVSYDVEFALRRIRY